MRKSFIITLLLALCSASYATDWVIPRPTTRDWTVIVAGKPYPNIEFRNVTIANAIKMMGNTMMQPLFIKHSLDEKQLKKEITLKLKKVSWLDIVTKIADEADASVKVVAGGVEIASEESE